MPKKGSHMTIAGGLSNRKAVKMSLLVLTIAFLLSRCANGADVSLTAEQVPSIETCTQSFEKFLMNMNVAAQMTNPDLLACAGGASEGCCRAIDSFLGPDSPIYGCSCHEELHSDAWETVYELAPIVSPGSNLAYIPVARPIVMQRIEQCNIPTQKNGMCPPMDDAAANQVVGVVADPAISVQGTTITIPKLNQSSSMVEYSAPYERVLEGFDEYGWFNPCEELSGAKYCLASLQAPGNFMQVRYGVCVPTDSKEVGIAQAITDTAPEHYEKNPPKVDCSVMTKRPLGIGGIIVASILALFLALVVVGTLVKQFRGSRRGGFAVEAIESFDFVGNWHYLMAKPQSGKGVDLRSLNGLRAVSMFWVILGHTLTYIIWIGGIAYPGRLVNPNNINMVVKKWFISIYSGGFFAVDTFFFLSGLLVAFLASREIEKRKQRRLTVRGEIQFWVMYVVNRFLRLLPVFAAVLFFFWMVAPSLSASPFWQHNWDKHSEDCAKYWWADLFFLNNFIPVGNPADGLAPTTCVGGTWYLAVDMQLYIFVAPIILIAWHHGFYLQSLTRYRKSMGFSLVTVMSLVSVGLACYTTIKKDVWLQYFGEGNFYYYYVKPWIRAPPYVLGLLLGLIFHHCTAEELGKSRMEYLKKQFPKWACVLALTFSVGILSALVFPIASYFNTEYEVPPITTTHSAGWSRDGVIAYNTVKFFAWGLALFALVLPTAMGRLAIVTELLSGHIWGPFAKLTYGAYLIHMLYPQALLTSTDNNTAYYHSGNTLGMWLIFTLGSYFWAAILFLVVEAPFGNLQKLIMSTIARGSSKGDNATPQVKRKVTDMVQGVDGTVTQVSQIPMNSVVCVDESETCQRRTPRIQAEHEMAAFASTPPRDRC